MTEFTMEELTLYSGLVRSVRDEVNADLTVDGVIPPGLQGTLYRMGPGLFERGGHRKTYLIDGDGMAQAFRFGNGGVQYRNRFVRTRKYVDESHAGEYLYDTWTFRAPEENVDPLAARSRLESQAFISVVFHHGRLFAFDESLPPYELDPESLETIGSTNLGTGDGAIVFSAHSKIDHQSGEWLHFGLEHNRVPRVHFTVIGTNGVVKKHFARALPRHVYIHDFFATENHLILNLHPAFVSLNAFLSGSKTFLESISWKAGEGNLLAVFHKSGTTEPILIEWESSWMLHAINAYEKGHQIIADFVGHELPDQLLGENPMYREAMRRRRVVCCSPGLARRYVIDPRAKRVQGDTLFDENHEFPVVHPGRACRAYRYAYAVRGDEDRFFWNRVAKLDVETGRDEVFDFGDGVFCSEPVFAPLPGSAQEDAGWLLSQVHDGHTNESVLAIFDAQRVTAGPIARCLLPQVTPLTFHGYWRAKGGR